MKSRPLITTIYCPFECRETFTGTLSEIIIKTAKHAVEKHNEDLKG